MKYLAIIPARGGSKGVPRKNVRSIAGKPLIAWTIEQALVAQHIDRVIVSTDSEEIADTARVHGADVPFIRPESLAGGDATTESAMIHALHWLEKNEGYKPDAVILLQCTSPVRADDAIDNAINHFESEHFDSLLSVTPFWHFLWSATNPPAAEYDYQDRPMRQNIPQKDIRHKENGSIYISKRSGLIEHGNRLFGQIGTFLMPESESYEIDSELDFRIVETILKHQALSHQQKASGEA